jgi:hypothetical protein
MDNSVLQEQKPSVAQPPPLKVKIPKKLVVALLGILVVILGGVFFYFFRSGHLAEDTAIATVNKKPIYKRYVNNELAYYPGSKPKDLEKKIQEKLINDEITLQEGVKKGWIKDYPQGTSLTPSEYLKRTDTVQKVKEKINESGDVIRGKTVMVWFYNNKHIGPGGIEASKKTAYTRIKPLYDQVKSGKMTIEEAGRIIKEDTSLEKIDPAWKWNALSPFVYYKDKSATWWPEYNKILWSTKEGDLTPLYLGGGILREGKPMEELYIFSLVEKKSTNSDYTEYRQWLEEKRKEYSVSYSMTSLLQNLNISKVFADDNGNNGSRSGLWYGTVQTSTGMPISGVTVRIVNGCNSPNGRSDVTNGNGGYNTGVDYNLSCLCNPQRAWVEFEGRHCDEKNGITIANGDATIEVNFTCSATPTPTPTPKLACNKPCTQPSDCEGAQDGCTVCAPATGGGNTCQPSPPTPTPVISCGTPCNTPSDCASAINGCTACLPNNAGTNVCSPVPACGTACQRDDQCAGARNGCIVCLGGSCQTPRACGTSCTRNDDCAGARDGCEICSGGVCKAPACGLPCTTPADCQGAKDGCTSCLAADTGTGNVCRPTPACGVACTKDAQCAGARNGCTNCTGGKCTAFREDMCKCDGMDFQASGGNQTFFPGDNVTFIAFGKVEGNDINIADLKSMTFSLYQSKLSDPNNAVRIAQSTAITPTIIQNDSNKVRYKVTWNHQIPTTVPTGTLFRVQAVIKCVAKPGVLGAKTQALGEQNYFTQLYTLVAGMFAKGNVLSASDEQLQLQPFFPGAKIQEKSCTFIKFFFE